MCFICRFNVYFSRNQRKIKCSRNGEDENLKFEIYEANDISSYRGWNSVYNSAFCFSF